MSEALTNVCHCVILLLLTVKASSATLDRNKLEVDQIVEEEFRGIDSLQAVTGSGAVSVSDEQMLISESDGVQAESFGCGAGDPSALIVTTPEASAAEAAGATLAPSSACLPDATAASAAGTSPTMRNRGFARRTTETEGVVTGAAMTAADDFTQRRPTRLSKSEAHPAASDAAMRSIPKPTTAVTAPVVQGRRSSRKANAFAEGASLLVMSMFKDVEAALNEKARKHNLEQLYHNSVLASKLVRSSTQHHVCEQLGIVCSPDGVCMCLCFRERCTCKSACSN